MGWWAGQSSRASATLDLDADVAQLVERDLAKVEVAGSSPVVRSKELSARPADNPEAFPVRMAPLASVDGNYPTNRWADLGFTCHTGEDRGAAC